MASSPSSEAPRIPLFKVHMPPRAALLPRLEDVLYSGQIGEGAAVVGFEREFGAFVGAAHCLAFSSGTAALHTALMLAGVRAGDEVVSTPMTAEPTNLAILHAGGTPVWADVDPANGNVSAATIAPCITSRTRAIVVVHYGGIPVDLAPVLALAARHGLPVIEDAAHALGARYAGHPIGTHSPFVMFSFQAIKHMTTVDGGMLAVADATLLPRGRRLRWFGIDRAAERTTVDVAEAGFKYHMNNVTATIGQVQLAHIVPVIARHIENGRYFDRALDGIADVERCTWTPAAEPSYWFYTVLTDRPDDLSRHLAAHGIASSKAHRRNDAHPVFAASRRALPGVDRFFARMLHLPCGWWVTDEDRDHIVDVMRRGW
ncbi:MAG: DegT/DnrJ/EryC1/StrS family aminotransferase [Gammaproteobacteria bacterium]